MTKTENLLNYYETNKISPVLYAVENWNTHFQRRDAAYRSLGLLPFSIRNADILEIAAGSGQNSVYLASQKPAKLHIVEPNPTALNDINRVFSNLPFDHTKPEIFPAKLDNFAAKQQAQYDVVICENWLGSDGEERGFRKLLSNLVKPGGIVISTCVNFTGFLPNVLRRLLANRVDVSGLGYQQREDLFTYAFGTHLSTIAGMTRSHVDWVRDCVLNPHYLQVGLDLEMLVSDAGNEMELCGTSPQFFSDYRWFKTMVGEQRMYNAYFVEQMHKNAHNLVSYMHTFETRSKEQNHGLLEVSKSIWELAVVSDQQADKQADDLDFRHQIGELASIFQRDISQISGDIAEAIQEFQNAWNAEAISADDLAEMTSFSKLFGREMMYCALVKNSF